MTRLRNKICSKSYLIKLIFISMVREKGRPSSIGYSVLGTCMFISVFQM